MNNPIVSIITPVYKVVKCLPKCIESVISQTFTEWEMAHRIEVVRFVMSMH